jgi:hypothetical protein
MLPMAMKTGAGNGNGGNQVFASIHSPVCRLESEKPRHKISILLKKSCTNALMPGSLATL